MNRSWKPTERPQVEGGRWQVWTSWWPSIDWHLTETTFWPTFFVKVVQHQPDNVDTEKTRIYNIYNKICIYSNLIHNNYYIYIYIHDSSASQIRMSQRPVPRTDVSHVRSSVVRGRRPRWRDTENGVPETRRTSQVNWDTALGNIEKTFGGPQIKQR